MKPKLKSKPKIAPIAVDPMLLAERLTAGATQLGLTLTATQHAQLLQFLVLLAQWNQIYNLTAVRDPLEMVARHLLDSLAIAPYLSGDVVLDLGTGAGLPGLPLAIIEPQRQFVLLDSNSKKIRFVRQAVLELALPNVTPVQTRIETYQAAQPFTSIVSRAVADIEVIGVLRSGLLAPAGRLLLMKGRMETLPNRQAWPPFHIHQLQIPFLDAARHIIEISFDA
ncbi:16S rRNA (guanine(527)-N(7))-methyltransferase RsmG [Chromatium okenii]|uniref:16S rRNA (guanine(527)-N(7))-methyltransferase RsmG n=1 Tax=Chromatium okenii TaxID=61644 RepID=UPI0026EDEB00|nr:16S rRNA (guanine(527)-N(7))-methyltransferase RsmG [Chromatium okenii]